MYSTPELLLVGAAQNLVLGDSEKRDASLVCGSDVPEADDLYFDIPAW